MTKNLTIRPAEDRDFLGLFLLYVPKEKYMLHQGKRLSESAILELLDSSLDHPEYKFYVLEYNLEIVAAFGLLNGFTDGAYQSEPVISDLRIADDVDDIGAVEAFIEHAILQARLAGFENITTPPDADLLDQYLHL